MGLALDWFAIYVAFGLFGVFPWMMMQQADYQLCRFDRLTIWKWFLVMSAISVLWLPFFIKAVVEVTWQEWRENF